MSIFHAIHRVLPHSFCTVRKNLSGTAQAVWYDGGMHPAFVIAMAIALLGSLWNIVALIMHLFGIDLMAIDPGMYPG